MTFGVNFSNQYGSYLIDTLYTGISLHSIHTATLVTGDPGGYNWVIDFPATTDPVAFVRCETPGVFAVADVVRDYRVFVKASCADPAIQKECFVECFVFSRAPKEKGTHGIATFGPNGELLFSSNWKTLRIPDAPVKVPDLPYPFSSIPTHNYSAPYVAKWAACLSGTRLWDKYTLSSQDGVNFLSDGVSYSVGPAASPGWVNQDEDYKHPTGGTVILADVTGY